LELIWVRIASLEDRIHVNFYNVEYEDIALFVGLQPDLNMNDIKMFGLHRSRIPTGLFKSIVQDIDVMMAQYGPPIENHTEEARFRFLSPIFNRLIAVFGFAFRNVPESTIKSITTKGRVEYYFRTIGSIAVLFIEIEIGSVKRRLDAFAQVIAEWLRASPAERLMGACSFSRHQRVVTSTSSRRLNDTVHVLTPLHWHTQLIQKQRTRTKLSCHDKGKTFSRENKLRK